jgi:hypothetical protein
MDKNKAYYPYVFSNFEQHTMTPLEAHQYSRRKMIDILQGPGYEKGKREKSFDGFGWHDSLRMSFKGPGHYRSYLKENNLVEAGIGDRPSEYVYEPPIWDEDLIRKAINVHGVDIGGVLAEALLKGELDWPDEG